MKRIFTIAIALLSIFLIIPNVSALVYNVTVPVGTEACFITGTMNTWTPPLDQRMIKVDATHFTLDIPTALVTDSFKYYSGPNWKYEERDAAGVALVKNRGWHSADVVANWAAVYKTAFEKDVTIDVLVPLTTVECYIVGNFNNWASPDAAHKMTKASTGTNGIDFSITVHTLDETTFEFRFCSGPAWSYQQTSTVNFNYVTDGAAVVVPSFKLIYDPAKTGTINIKATVPAGTSEAWILGDFLGWNMTNAIKGTKNPDGTWSFSLPLVMTIEYRLYNRNDWGYAEVGVGALTTDLPNRVAIYPADANSAITVYAWKQSFTVVPQVDINNYKIYSLDKSIVVEGVTSQVEIIDLSGRKLQSHKLTGNFTSNLLKSGLYIVRVDGATRKVVVK